MGNCYGRILEKNVLDPQNDCNWKHLWKLKVPNRICFFLWLLRKNKLLTNRACVSRGINQDDKCKFCHQTEDEEHIFRSCSRAQNVWALIDPTFGAQLNNNDFLNWLDKNLFNFKNFDSGAEQRGILFVSSLWNIWKARNEFQFCNTLPDCGRTTLKSLNDSSDIVKAFERSQAHNQDPYTKLIRWVCPDAGDFKINTDGSLDHWQRGSFGGLVRDDQGKWIEGFCGNIGCATVIRAELWAIRVALKICTERNWTGVRIETDCLNAVRLVHGEDDEENHPDRVLVEDCIRLIRERNTAIIHVRREGNRCADRLAKLGGEQTEQEVRLMIPPEELIDDLRADAQGTWFYRGCSSLLFFVSVVLSFSLLYQKKLYFDGDFIIKS